MSRHLGYGNARSCSTYTVDGITDTLRGWAERLGTSYICLYKRIAIRGMSPEDAIRQGCEPMHFKYLTANGETHTISEWGRLTGIDADKISERLVRGGWSVEEALELVPHESNAENPIKWRGVTRSQSEWAKVLGLDVNLFYARVREWRAGRLLKKDVFRKTKGASGRKRRFFQKVYRGKRYTVKELAEKKGVGTTWFHARLDEGHTVHNIMENVQKVSHHECGVRSAESCRRNRRRRELRQMGVVV